MSADASILLFATVAAVVGATVIFVADLRNDRRPRGRVVGEAVIPAIGLAVLLWWSWVSL